MLYYPQLTPGSVAQFPLTRGTTTRTVTNKLVNGGIITDSDPHAGIARWQLHYSDLTDNEWSSIEQLFEQVEGRLNTFTFLDPTDNLLMWSEDWTRPVWTADPLLQVALNIQDPFGGSNAVQITNTSQTTGRILQAIAGPSWFHYCFSVHLRSDVPLTVHLVSTSQGQQDSLSAIAVSSAWSRAAGASIVAIQQDGISFGLQLPPGTQIEAFGAQVEAQLAAGPYKKNIDRGGVYPSTRFDSDSLLRSADALNQNSCSLNLVSTLT